LTQDRNSAASNDEAAPCIEIALQESSAANAELIEERLPGQMRGIAAVVR